MENKTLYECVKNLEKDYAAFSSEIGKRLGELKAAYLRLDCEISGKQLMPKDPFLEMPNFDDGTNVCNYSTKKFEVPIFDED